MSKSLYSALLVFLLASFIYQWWYQSAYIYSGRVYQLESLGRGCTEQVIKNFFFNESLGDFQRFCISDKQCGVDNIEDTLSDSITSLISSQNMISMEAECRNLVIPEELLEVQPRDFFELTSLSPSLQENLITCNFSRECVLERFESWIYFTSLVFSSKKIDTLSIYLIESYLLQRFSSIGLDTKQLRTVKKEDVESGLNTIYSVRLKDHKSLWIGYGWIMIHSLLIVVTFLLVQRETLVQRKAQHEVSALKAKLKSKECENSELQKAFSQKQVEVEQLYSANTTLEGEKNEFGSQIQNIIPLKGNSDILAQIKLFKETLEKSLDNEKAQRIKVEINFSNQAQRLENLKIENLSLNTRLVEMKKRVEQVQNDLQTSLQTSKDLKQENSKQQKIMNEERKVLSTQIVTLETSLDQEKKQNEKLVLRLNHSISELNISISRLEEENKQLLAKKLESDGLAEDFRCQCKDMSGKLEETMKELESAKKQLQIEVGLGELKDLELETAITELKSQKENNFNLEDATSKLKTLTNELQEKVNTLTVSLEQLTSCISDKDADISNLKSSLEKQEESHQSEILGMNSTIEHLSSQELMCKQEVEILRTNMVDAERIASSLKEEVLALQKDAQSKNEEILKHKEQLAQFKRKLDDYKLRESQDNMKNSNEVDTLQTKIGQLEGQVQNIQTKYFEQLDICKKHSTEIDSLHIVESELQQQIMSKEGDIEKLSKAKSYLKAQLNDYKHAMDIIQNTLEETMQVFTKEKDDLLAAIDDLQQTIKEQEQEKNTLEETISGLTRTISEKSHSTELFEEQKHLNSKLKEENDSLNQKLEKECSRSAEVLKMTTRIGDTTDEINSQYDKVREQYETLFEKYSLLLLEEERLRGEVDRITSILDNQKASLNKSVDEYQKKVNDLEKLMIDSALESEELRGQILILKEHELTMKGEVEQSKLIIADMTETIQKLTEKLEVRRNEKPKSNNKNNSKKANKRGIPAQTYFDLNLTSKNLEQERQ